MFIVTVRAPPCPAYEQVYPFAAATKSLPMELGGAAAAAAAAAADAETAGSVEGRLTFSFFCSGVRFLVQLEPSSRRCMHPRISLLPAAVLLTVPLFRCWCTVAVVQVRGRVLARPLPPPLPWTRSVASWRRWGPR
jgi:hypothetical protein